MISVFLDHPFQLSPLLQGNVFYYGLNQKLRYFIGFFNAKVNEIDYLSNLTVLEFQNVPLNLIDLDIPTPCSS